MANFRTQSLTIDGERYALRELTAGALIDAQTVGDELAQSMAIVGLSLTEHGAARFASATEAVAYVRDQPLRVFQALAVAVKDLNPDLEVEAARGN